MECGLRTSYYLLIFSFFICRAGLKEDITHELVMSMQYILGLKGLLTQLVAIVSLIYIPLLLKWFLFMVVDITMKQCYSFLCHQILSSVRAGSLLGTHMYPHWGAQQALDKYQLSKSLYFGLCIPGRKDWVSPLVNCSVVRSKVPSLCEYLKG